MKHIIATLVLAAAAATSQAQTYSNSVRIQAICAKAGENAREIYNTGKLYGHSKEAYLAHFVKSGGDRATLDFVLEKFNSVEQGNPSSAHNAYMQAWAACMDKLN